MPDFPQSLCSPVQVSRFLVEAGIKPSRAQGQNFLTDKNTLEILLAAASPVAEDTVLEIGPGLGVVTGQLVNQCGKVFAIEKDRRLFALLGQRFAGVENIELIHADALEKDLNNWVIKHGVNLVVSNLPYSVASRILVELCIPRRTIETLVVTVQREVAVRMAAPPGKKTYGLLSVLLQAGYHVEIVKNVAATCFWPRPEVDSAIVCLRRLAQVDYSSEESLMMCAMAKYAFSRRRKMLGPALGAWIGGQGISEEFFRKEIMPAHGVPQTARPETVAPAQWLAMAREICNSKSVAGCNP